MWKRPVEPLVLKREPLSGLSSRAYHVKGLEHKTNDMVASSVYIFINSASRTSILLYMVTAVLGVLSNDTKLSHECVAMDTKLCLKSRYG
jgi:hypothetical protein